MYNFVILLSVVTRYYYIAAFSVAGRHQETTPFNMTSSSSAAEVGVASDGDHAQLFTCAPVFIRKPQSSSVIEGDPVKFTCQVQGHPDPQVRWEKDGKPVEMTSEPRFKVKLLLCYVVYTEIMS